MVRVIKCKLSFIYLFSESHFSKIQCFHCFLFTLGFTQSFLDYYINTLLAFYVYQKKRRGKNTHIMLLNCQSLVAYSLAVPFPLKETTYQKVHLSTSRVCAWADNRMTMGDDMVHIWFQRPNGSCVVKEKAQFHGKKKELPRYDWSETN